MIVGIDLGTSNSLVGVWRDGQHVLIPNALGRLLTPSAVSLLENGEIVVGQAARDRVFTHPDRTASAFKRYMGTDRTFTLGRRGFRVEELSALVLAQLKADAEAWLGEPVDEAVVTVPAYFNDKQRKATRAAGEIAGLKVERLLNEPTAAALAYGLDTIRSMAGDAAILVVDLGGGTFDVSILDLFEGVMEVRATAGDNFLGGEDFVDAIVDAFMAEVGRAAGIAAPSADDATGNPAYGLLRRQAELAKRTLSSADSATLSVPHEGREVSWELTQERFGLLVEPLLQRLRQPLSRAMRDARLKPENLTQIVLAGGATRMPAIRRMVAQLFGRLPASHIGPDEVVARGAAVQAGLKARDQALDEIVLTDVAPFSLGIEVTRQDAGRRHQGLFSPILERNTVIPASRVEGYRTVADGQDTIEVSIYQGEARLVRDNIALGSLSVPVPKAKAGEQAIEVRFTYDVSGLLDVEVTVVSTGAVLRKVIEGNAGALNPQEIEAKRASLQALKVHPRDQAENQAVLSRAERLFEENLGWARAQIGEWTDRFVTILERQDPREIAAARQVLSERLAAVDHEPFA